jgi:hypothetical protein
VEIANTSWHNDSGTRTSLQTKYYLSKGKHLQRKEYLSGKEKRLIKEQYIVVSIRSKNKD